MQLIKVIKHLFHPQRSNNHRPRFLHPKPLLFLTLIALGFYQLVGFASTVGPVKGSVLGYASNITVVQVLDSTNQERLKSGLQELSYNERLAQAATAKAQNMFSENYWAHTSPSGKEPWDFIKASGYSYRIAGENLARDFDTTPTLMRAWMNSPTHRANIMNPRYREIGIAVVDGQLNGLETTLVVQMFGTKDTQTLAKKPTVAVPAIATDQTVNSRSELTLAKKQEVLARSAVPTGSLSKGILYSPKHLLKAFFLSIVVVLLAVLLYDAIVAGHKNSVRFVGKNFAHILLFLSVMYLIIAFKGGVVGS